MKKLRFSKETMDGICECETYRSWSSAKSGNAGHKKEVHRPLLELSRILKRLLAIESHGNLGGCQHLTSEELRKINKGNNSTIICVHMCTYAQTFSFMSTFY